MTNIEIKNQIDSQITNKIQSSSITPSNVGTNLKILVDYVDEEIQNVAVQPGPQGPQGEQGIVGPAGPQGIPGPAGAQGLAGPIGPQGPQGLTGATGTTGAQGIAGPPGPVGPAGLNWQGQWVSGTSYVVNDAVGFAGASWFCIANTSGTTSPNLDTTNWALLAAQGAQGQQGIQGPQGIQGIQGETGPQGPIGPQGVAGPVGPAGLNWQGQWTSGTSYVLDDAVGYNGASWFCINATSGTTPPNLDATNWALLAAQGATGPQGPQGVSGSIAYTEQVRNTTSQAFAENPSHTGSKITSNFVRAYVSSGQNNFLGLSDVGKVVGEQFTIRNYSSVHPLFIVLLDNARLLGIDGSETTQLFKVLPNTYARFTLINTTSGSNKVFMVEVINPLGKILPYKKFSGRIFQGSISNPITLTVMENDFDSIPVVTNFFGNAAIFSVTLSNQFVFEKTIVKANPERNNIIIGYPSDDNSNVFFDSFDFSETPQAPISFTFEIKVYD